VRPGVAVVPSFPETNEEICANPVFNFNLQVTFPLSLSFTMNLEYDELVHATTQPLVPSVSHAFVAY